jgi:hypothetical protein
MAESVDGDAKTTQFTLQDAVNAVKAVQAELPRGTVNLTGALVRVGGGTWRTVTRRSGSRTESSRR